MSEESKDAAADLPENAVGASEAGSGSRGKNERMWAMLTHLSALSGFVGVPLGNVIGPLVIWMIKKDEFPGLEAHGKEAINFQISVVIYIVVLSFVGGLTLVILIGFIFFLAAGLVYVAGIILTVVAGLKANEGERYDYPFSIRFIK